MLNLVRAAQQREGVAKQSFFTTALELYSQILYQLKVANEHLHSEAALKDPTALHDMVPRRVALHPSPPPPPHRASCPPRRSMSSASSPASCGCLPPTTSSSTR